VRCHAPLWDYHPLVQLLELRQVETNPLIRTHMHDSVLGNYLATYRKQVGLSQKELCRLVGYTRPWPVGRHERSKTVAPLMIALAYEAIFQKPVSAIFSGMYLTVAQSIEKELAGFAERLRAGSGKGRTGRMNAKKLAWIMERNLRRATVV
jgi:DNA-binding XRE family transcriptional regulator